MIDLTEFFSIQGSLIGSVAGLTGRFLKEKINWDNRLVGILGGRGTGKTTILVQYLAEQDRNEQRHLYVSADHIQVQATGLYEIAAAFFRLGGKTILIDEIHKYANWQQEVKNLYDAFPSGRIVFSGSSLIALQKGKADLSRRAVFYTLPGLSFREYLYFAHALAFEPTSLSNLIQNHAKLASLVLVAQRSMSRPLRIEYGGPWDSMLDNLSTPELIQKDVPGEDDDAVADFSFVSITTDNSEIFHHALLT